jgi:tetratricopeptide (TPR) repeat protein
MLARLVALGLALALAACGPASRSRPRGPQGDAPYDLAQDDDLASRRAEHDALAPTAEARVSARRVLADEYARRADLHLAAGDRTAARGDLGKLLTMWSPAELDGDDARAEVARHRPLLDRARAVFGRAGDDLGAATVLAVLMWLEPEAPSHLAELDELFRYADDLSIAKDGAGAERARTIEVLAAVAKVFPSRAVVDRLVLELIARRRSVEHDFRRSAGSVELVRAHKGVTRTVFAIAAALARADRLAEVPRTIAAVTGLGDDRELKARVAAALAPAAQAKDLEQLAAWFRAGGGDGGDDAAALAVAHAGLRRFPAEPRLHRVAADAADALEQPQVAIGEYEAALASDVTMPGAATALAELYQQHTAELLQADRPRAARRALTRYEVLARRAAAAGVALEPDLASVWATVGRGFLSLGALDEARAYLGRSLDRRANRDALEALGTMELKLGDADEAVRLLRRALKLAGAGPEARYQRAKLFRPLGDALAAAGDAAAATSTREAGLDEWNAIATELDLPRRFLAESLVERGKILWRLAAREQANAAFHAAVDADPGGTSIHADIVAFLLNEGAMAASFDAYLAGLAGPEVSDYYKVYMSLWLMAEALRRGEPPPARAQALLAGRTSHLWHDQLARLATGRATVDSLLPRATTRGHRAELYYYAAVLGDARRDPPRARALLEQVVATDMLLYFEYEMAQRWLARLR